MELLSNLAQDKSLLSELLYNVKNDPSLMDMCECHTYDDKIVLFNGLNTHGYRIRFRLAKDVEHERIHNHRFSAIHHILIGKFKQKFYYPNKPILSCNSCADFNFDKLSYHIEKESFEVNYKDFHSSQTTPGTISLLLRGPVKNDIAIGINCNDNSIRVRKGYMNSTKEENIQHKMSTKTFLSWVDLLIKEKVIYTQKKITS